MTFPSLRTDKLAQQISVKSAVNPALWACLFISLPLFYLASSAKGWFSVAAFFVGVVPVAAFALSYIYLLFRNPDYLRSEEYQLRMNTMRMMGDKDNPLGTKPEHLISMVNNPALPLPTPQQDQDEHE